MPRLYTKVSPNSHIYAQRRRYTIIKIWKMIVRRLRYRLGRLFELGFGDVKQNEFQAVEWYGKADDYSHAQLALGDCYRRGRGCQKDLNRSLEASCIHNFFVISVHVDSSR